MYYFSAFSYCYLKKKTQDIVVKIYSIQDVVYFSNKKICKTLVSINLTHHKFSGKEKFNILQMNTII